MLVSSGDGSADPGPSSTGPAPHTVAVGLVAGEIEAVELRATARAMDAMGVGYGVLDARWRYLAFNDTAAAMTLSSSQELVGATMWERFPALLGSEFERRYRRALQTGQVQTFQAHYPAPLDIWVEVVAAPLPAAPDRAGVLELMFADVTDHRAVAAQAELATQVERAATELASRAAAEQAGLVGIAQALAGADSQDDVVEVLADRGNALLGANGCGLCLRDPDGEHISTVITDSYAQVRTVVQKVPLDFPLPAIASAASGRAVFLPDRAAAEQACPGAAVLYAEAGVEASAAVPLLARGEVLGCLSVGFAAPRRFTALDRDLMAAFAALTAQAIARIDALARERDASAAVARFSETMQRSLLSKPSSPDHLQIAVRYSPAAAEAFVGGDWYDVFTTPDGATSLVIGDVAGHDRTAAAAMAQLRNMLRGIAYTSGGAPASVLTALDAAAEGLDVGTVATAVLARIEQTGERRGAGRRRLRWSNAGHPPPLLVGADGTVQFLDRKPELMLGVFAGAPRTDHVHLLAPGDVVVLFTDGLTERRGADLDDGLTWLARTAHALRGADPEEICDRLLAEVGGQLQDDVALLVLRVGSEPDADT